MQQTIITQLITFIIEMSAKYGIDASHGIGHSLNVLKHAQASYEIEIVKEPALAGLYNVIMVSAMLHDMCDKKYMEEANGLADIRRFLPAIGLSLREIELVLRIITTMSYSVVKRFGYFPTFGQPVELTAYHIVREADLLDAYDFNRCIIFHMNRNSIPKEATTNPDIMEAFTNAMRLFDNRMFKHEADGLILLDYSKSVIPSLEAGSRSQIEFWQKMLSSTDE